MNIMKPEDYAERRESVPPYTVHITSYRLGEVFHCTVDNVDPGAVIARSKGSTREEAEAIALRSAINRLMYSSSRQA